MSDFLEFVCGCCVFDDAAGAEDEPRSLNKRLPASTGTVSSSFGDIYPETEELIHDAVNAVTKVIIAWLLCTLSVVITVHGLWFFVTESIMRVTVDLSVLSAGELACLVRVLYVKRLWKLSKSFTLFNFRRRLVSAIASIIAICLCIVELAGSIEISLRLYTSSDAAKGDAGTILRPVFILIFATGIGADAILTGMMCLWLNSARTGLKRWEYAMPLPRIASSLVETGGMIAFFANPTSQIFLAFYLQIGVLYLSSLLTSLNARRKVKQRIEQPFSVNFSALNHVYDSSSPSGTVTDGDGGGVRASSELPPSVRHLTIPRPSHLVMRAHSDDIMLGDDKAMTPDVERPQGQLERGMLGRTHPSVGYQR
ncbi:hypothetical protein ONZ51_g8086 [Trametes cubensis]|uniref:DUF6534 domain-containing protein n=1 Tax=Trametes cubensis TaxID=1111947 RepID=A0AAD7TP98_9APHY|nr:hypothetical protein ONZ51_g8086 [Trametes cubensis]